MTRYFKLYLQFLSFSFSRGFEFRFDFIIRIIMDLGYYSINIIFYKVIFAHTNLLGNWQEGQIMIFVASYLLVDAIVMAVFSDNLFVLPSFVQSGELDYYLIRPVSSLFFLSLRNFSASSFFNVLIASGYLIWTLLASPDAFIPWRLPLFLLLIFNGAILHYIIVMFFNILVFWIHSGAGLMGIAWTLTKFRERPHGIFKGGIRIALLTVIPYSLMSSVPSAYLFGDENYLSILLIAVVTTVLFILMKSFWNLGLKNYSSASS